MISSKPTSGVHDSPTPFTATWQLEQLPGNATFIEQASISEHDVNHLVCNKLSESGNVATFADLPQCEKEARKRRLGSNRDSRRNLREDEAKKIIEDSRDLLIHRYTLQTYSRDILSNDPDDTHGVCFCHRKRAKLKIDGRIYVEPAVAVNVDTGANSASISRVFRCGSVWTCPVCAHRIAARRRAELVQGLSAAAKLGWSVVMVTYTMRHKRKDHVSTVLNKLIEGVRAISASYWYKQLKAEYGYQGNVLALEVTYGFRNGWHPHRHVLMFFDRQLSESDIKSIQSRFRQGWKAALYRLGCDASWRHGVTVQAADKAALYVAKWGIQSEMVNSPSKEGRKSEDGDQHYTPFQLLEMFGLGDKWISSLWLEYTKAFKTKKQLQWSNGLKAMLGVDEVEDDDIEEQTVKDANRFAQIDGEDWDRLMRLPNDPRPEIMLAALEAAKHDPESFVTFMFSRFRAKSWLVKDLSLFPEKLPRNIVTLPGDELATGDELPAADYPMDVELPLEAARRRDRPVYV